MLRANVTYLNFTEEEMEGEVKLQAKDTRLPSYPVRIKTVGPGHLQQTEV